MPGGRQGARRWLGAELDTEAVRGRVRPDSLTEQGSSSARWGMDIVPLEEPLKEGVPVLRKSGKDCHETDLLLAASRTISQNKEWMEVIGRHT